MTDKERISVLEEALSVCKADKEQSHVEFCNSLSASLKVYHEDFWELREMEPSADVQEALIETLDSIFKVLSKNGIK